MAEREEEGEVEKTVCISKASGIDGKTIVALMCEEKGGRKQKSGEEGAVGATRTDATKRGCEGEEEEEKRKRAKREVAVEEEEVFEIDSRYGEYLYEK